MENTTKTTETPIDGYLAVNARASMSKTEAIQAMKEGHKVTHVYFADDEYIYMIGIFKIFTEEGYSIDSDEFWKYRQGESFETGWSIFEENI